jgi:hypothetical protein
MSPVLRFERDADQGPVIIGGWGEAVQFISVERARAGELEPMQSGRWAVISEEMLRALYDEPEPYRSLFLPEKACLVTGGNDPFQNGPVGEPERQVDSGTDPPFTEQGVLPDFVDERNQLFGIGVHSRHGAT